MTNKKNWRRRQVRNTRVLVFLLKNKSFPPSPTSLGLWVWLGCFVHLWLKVKSVHSCTRRTVSSHILVWQRAEILKFWARAMSPGHLHPGCLLSPCKPLARGPTLFRLTVLHAGWENAAFIVLHLVEEGAFSVWSERMDTTRTVQLNAALKKHLLRNVQLKASWHHCGPLASGPKARMVYAEEALWESIKTFCMQRGGEGETMGIGSICETSDVFTVQFQTHLLANYLQAHAFGSLQKWYLDQA